MRRLPVFFLVDVSESMVGESLYNIEDGIRAVISTLRQDPYALESAFLSVIVFAGKAKTVTQLTELMTFYPPELPVGAGTALGVAMNHLMDEIDRVVVTTTPEHKGDWKPIIFLLTDGHPTDDVTNAVDRWNRKYRARTNLVAVSIGGGADHEVLKRLTLDVVVFNDAAPDAFAGFIKWISMSIQSQTRSVKLGQDGKISLAKADPNLLAPLENLKERPLILGVDERYAVFVGKCSKSKLPYIVKYQRQLGHIETRDPVLSKILKTRHYALTTAVPIKNSYFDLSEGVSSGQSIKSEELFGQPSCPHCGARFGMAVCGCGGVHCIDGGGEQVCPWCSKTGVYVFSADGESFDIGRGKG